MKNIKLLSYGTLREKRRDSQIISIGLFQHKLYIGGYVEICEEKMFYPESDFFTKNDFVKLYYILAECTALTAASFIRILIRLNTVKCECWFALCHFK